MRIARLNLLAGTTRSWRPAWPKLKSLRKSAIQMLGSGFPPPRPPLRPEKSNSWSSVASGKTLFQL